MPTDGGVGGEGAIGVGGGVVGVGGGVVVGLGGGVVVGLGGGVVVVGLGGGVVVGVSGGVVIVGLGGCVGVGAGAPHVWFSSFRCFVFAIKIEFSSKFTFVVFVGQGVPSGQKKNPGNEQFVPSTIL